MNALQVKYFLGRNEMVNYGKISMESKKGTRFDMTSDTEPQMVFVPSQGNILVGLTYLIQNESLEYNFFSTRSMNWLQVSSVAHYWVITIQSLVASITKTAKPYIVDRMIETFWFGPQKCRTCDAYVTNKRRKNRRLAQQA